MSENKLEDAMTTMKLEKAAGARFINPSNKNIHKREMK